MPKLDDYQTDPVADKGADQIAHIKELWQILQPWVQVENVVSFEFRLAVDEMPRIMVTYYPGPIQAETIAILIKQFELVEVHDHQPDHS